MKRHSLSHLINDGQYLVQVICKLYDGYGSWNLYGVAVIVRYGN